MEIKTDIDRQKNVHAAAAMGRLAGTGRALAAALLVPLVLVIAMLLGIVSPAGAAESAQPAKGFSYDLGIALGITAVDINNAHFGLGVGGLESHDPKADFIYLKDVSRVEGYLAPRAGARLETDKVGTFYGGVRVVAAATRGDGDPWYLTTDDPSNIGLDNLYVGWKSGDTIPDLGKDGLDVSVGSQNFQLGDGMVLVDGNDEANKHGAIYWLDPQQGWENSGILRLNAAPVKLELFALDTNHDSGNDSILGGNLELVHPKMGGVGVSYFSVLSSDVPARDGLAARDGLQVAGVHGRGRPLPFFPLLELAGEVDLERNSNPDVKAMAWFAEANLSLYMLPWYPTIGYRYASFSGDDAGTADKNEGWDYLHNGSTSRGFGYWYQGIVVGTYETRLSNLDTHFVHLTVAPPIKGTWCKLLYYDHRFNDTSTARLDLAGVSSDRFATEWDVIVGYSPSKNVDYMAIFGRAKPGAGGMERTYGAEEIETLIQFVLLLRY